MENAQAVSLNGNSAQVMGSLFEAVKPGFESLLEKFQGLDTGNLTPSSMAAILEKFNTTIESMSLAKNVFKGNVPEVFGNLTNLAETFFERASASADKAPAPDQAPGHVSGTESLIEAVVNPFTMAREYSLAIAVLRTC